MQFLIGSFEILCAAPPEMPRSGNTLDQHVQTNFQKFKYIYNQHEKELHPYEISIFFCHLAKVHWILHSFRASLQN